MALARTHQQARSLVRRQAPCLTQACQLHLTPREADHLQLHQVGALAQKRLARGLRLNQPEAVGLISTVMLEKIRDGVGVAELMQTGQQLLGRRQTLPGVPEVVQEVQVEGTFPDGTNYSRSIGPSPLKTVIWN